MVPSSSQCSKCLTTPFPVRDIAVVVLGSYTTAHSGMKQECLFGICLKFFFLVYKMLHYNKDPFWHRGSSFGGSMFNEVWERSFRHVRPEAVPVYFHVPKNHSMKRSVRGCFWFGMILRELSEFFIEGKISVWHFLWQDVRKKSSRFVWKASCFFNDPRFVSRRWGNFCSICWLHQFCSNELTTLCGGYWIHEKYES